MTTLISFIGTGQRDLTGIGYQRTAYDWPGRKPAPPSPFFVGTAIHHLRPTAVVIIGTRTSHWAALVETFRADHADLYVHLDEATRAGARDADLDRLAELLKATWGIPVRCLAVAERTIDGANAAQILATCAGLIPVRGEVVLDVTHAFRSLVMLALGAVHLRDACHPGLAQRVQVIYGDLIRTPAAAARSATSGPALGEGRMIDLTILPEAAGLAAAASAAVRCLDLDPLALALHQRDPALAKACKEVARCLRALDLDHLGKPLLRLITHLESSSDPLVAVVSTDLVNLVRPLAGKPLAQALCTLTAMANDRGLWSLALFAAYEAFCVHATNGQTVADDGNLNEAIAAAVAGWSASDRNALEELKHCRNQSAHGSHRIDRAILDPKKVIPPALAVLNRRIPTAASRMSP